MKKILGCICISAGLLLGLATGPAQAQEGAQSAIERGKDIAFNRKKGNCLACHAMADGVSPGNFGPPLMNMQQRYSSKAKIRDRIWDATRMSPNTPMPPFGHHKILTEEEIDLVTEFVWSL